MITDKCGSSALRRDVLERLAAEMAEALAGEGSPRVVLGHGSGSFGHVAARRHRIGNGPIGEGGGAHGAAVVRHEAARLHREVVGALVEAGLPAVSVAPSSCLVARRGRPSSGTLDPLLESLRAGFLPVVYGDVLADREWGASIASTESIFGYLVRRLRRRGLGPRRALWLGETEGVLAPDGTTVREVSAENVSAVRGWVGASGGTDVTGGMVLRLETSVTLARMGVTSWIVDGRRPGLLRDALEGADPGGTRVVASDSPP